MADRYWVGGSGNWLDAAAHWSDVSGGTPNASFLPTENDDVYFNDASIGSNTIVTVTTSTGDHRCKNIDSSGLTSRTVGLGTTYYNQLWVYGSVNINSKMLLKNPSYYGVTIVLKSAVSETITLAGGTMFFIAADSITGKWTFQDASYTSEQIYDIGIYAGEIDLNSKTYTLPGGFSLWGANSILTCGSATITCGRLSLYWGSVLNGDTSTFNLSFNSNSQCWLTTYSTQVFYNLNITNTSTSGSSSVIALYSYLHNGELRVTNNLTITGYDRKNMILVIKQGYWGGNSDNGETYTINAENITASNVGFCKVDFIGNGDYDFSSDDTVGDFGLNTGATFIAPINAYYYQNTGNYCDAKWFTATNGGGSACRVPLPQDTGIFDQNSFSGPTTFTIDTHCPGGIDMSAVNQSITVQVVTPDFVDSYSQLNLFIAGSFLLNNVTSFGPLINIFWQINFIGESKSINLNDLTITAYIYLISGYDQTYELTGGFTVGTMYGIRVRINFNSHSYFFNYASFYTSNNYLMSSTITVHNTSSIGAGSLENAGTSKLYISPNTIYGMNIQGPSNNHCYWNDVEIVGDKTGYVTFASGFDVNNMVIAKGMKVKIFSKYNDYRKLNFFNTLTLNGEADDIITIRANLDTYTQAFLVKKTKGFVEAVYVDIQDSNLTGQENIKNVESATLATMKQTLGVVKSSLKRIMGVFVKDGGIATHSVDSGNNTGWTITP